MLKTGVPVLIKKFEWKPYMSKLVIERNQTNIRILDLKSTFKISRVHVPVINVHVFSQKINMVLLFNCFLHP